MGTGGEQHGGQEEYGCEEGRDGQERQDGQVRNPVSSTTPSEEYQKPFLE